MVKGNKIPDAWDDDWESQADKLAREEEAASSSKDDKTDEAVTMTRSERLAKHSEQQRKLWEAAEQPPDELLFVAATSNAPLTTAFKPAMKLLSRKPAPKTVMRKDPVTGLDQLTLQDDEDEDDDAKKHQPTPEEIRLRQQKELEEKQRRYEEARAKIFGGSNPSSEQSSPGNVTPPRSSEGRQGQRGKARGRGAHRGENKQDHQRPDTPGRRQQPVNQAGTRELFDPNYSAKPGFNIQKRGGREGSGSPRPSSSSREEDQVIRAPRGPDGSGRGGFGFARRGGPKAD